MNGGFFTYSNGISPAEIKNIKQKMGTIPSESQSDNLVDYVDEKFGNISGSFDVALDDDISSIFGGNDSGSNSGGNDNNNNNGGGDNGNTNTPPTYAFSTATEEQIASMLEAHYNGDINIEDHWHVGDTRTITHAAMEATGVDESHDQETITYTIIGINHDDLNTPINGKTKAAITLQTREILGGNDEYGSYSTSNGLGYLNPSNYNGGWKNCARRTWCNSIYYNALPIYIKNLVKDVKKQNYSNYDSTTLIETIDKAFLLSETEVFGSTGTVKGPGRDEGSRYAYYADGHGKKYGNNNGEPNIRIFSWWERTPCYISNIVACYASGYLEAGHWTVNSNYGISPAICL